MKKILLTGANGYIGKRILPILAENGDQVYCVVRDPSRFKVPQAFSENVQVFKADLTNEKELAQLPKEIDYVFFLVHAMSGGGKFNETELKIAENFKQYLNQTTAKQCIYLGGIANDKNLSKHLKSRQEVEAILNQSEVPLTVLRAAIVIGSGSASFEIIRDLVEKLPVMITPKWVSNRCQPIAVKDVLAYLTGVIGKEETYGKVFDIGGPEILTYEEMMQGYAKKRDLKRYIIHVPVMTPKLSSYWLYFITSTSYPLAVSLVSSLKNEAVCEEGNIDEILPIEKTGYMEGLKLAFSKIEQNAVASSWTDAVSKNKYKKAFNEMIEIPVHGCLKDYRSVTINTADADKVFENIWKIGGDTGWYYMNWAWRLRGTIDKLFGGVGIRRGRRSPVELQIGDALDFWRVILADKDARRLLLYAEMKLPGEAWLEFRINPQENGKTEVLQNATFRPLGVSGRLYWYALYPFHKMIFRGMLNKIVKH